MKHKRLTALVLAAAVVLTGCGGTTSSSGSAATSQSTGSSQNAPALAIQKERITEQFTLEKTIRDEYDITYRLNIHVPQLVCYRTPLISTMSLPPCMRQNSESTRTARRSNPSRTRGARILMILISIGTPTGTATA